MATIVRHRQTGDHYVLLGSGFGAYQSSRPGFLDIPKEEKGEIRAVMVCDDKGEFAWVTSSLLEVVSIDGQSPGDVLRNAANG